MKNGKNNSRLQLKMGNITFSSANQYRVHCIKGKSEQGINAWLIRKKLWVACIEHHRGKKQQQQQKLEKLQLIRN